MKRKKQLSKKQLLQVMSTEEKSQKKTLVHRQAGTGMENGLARLLERRPDIQRLGILGGTFNPVHIGHVQLAQEMIAAAELDLLVLMPTGQPPHKQAPYLAPAEDRLEMCRLAVRGIPDCYVSDMEIRRGGKSYTVETLREIKRFAPGVKIFLITGADMFLTIGGWYKAKEILSLCVPCAAPRDLATVEVLREYASYIGVQESVVVPFVPAPVSSTKVREAVRQGKKLDGMVPQEVGTYILSHQLYREAKKLTEAQLIEIVKEKVSPARFQHTMCVKHAAEELARKYGGDVQRAAAAGILHDIMKDAGPSVQLQTLEESDIILSAVERIEPKLWHAMAGSVYIREELKIQDEEIINAVRYHTTGRAGMTLMDKILYVADFISDDRSFDGVEKLRKIAREDLNRAVFEGLQFSIQDLAQRERFIHPDTTAGYNEYLIQRLKK